MAVPIETFVPFSIRFEGDTDWMYCDVLELVTTGIGLLIDPEPAAHVIDWVHPDGSPVSASEVTAAWNAVKARPDLRLRGGGAYKSITTIRATKESVARVVEGRLRAFEAALRLTFPCYDAWPQDAQLATCSMAWAMGPAFALGWPKFTAACLAQDWEAAAQNCRMNDATNPGLRSRNAANAALFYGLVVTPPDVA